ncbi:MAG TPA: Nif3-like dinuclear metal center hexameric protein [Thermoanaerobaculia bacterium]|nr:Nif3-like dinuclear metal center hexameric protein [Thermoanaerobaculia bacterium]
MVRGAGIDCETLVEYLDDYLQAGQGRDYCPNGLQVEGRRRIHKLVTGVSACQALFDRARHLGADALLVHHGLFWEGDSRALTGVAYRRVAELVRSEVALLAYHLPLDRHPEVGNNAVAARRLGLIDLEPFAFHDGLAVGFSGTFPAPLTPVELVARCRHLFGAEPLAFLSGPDSITSLGIVSGRAEREVHRAIRQGLDAYVTGEATEWVMNLVREAGIHYLACGHHATERLGIQALGDHIAMRFDIEVEFVDVPNPV